MDDSRFLSLLGLCRKAGKLSCGHDSALEAIKAKKARLCLFSSDSSERLKKDINHELDFMRYDVPKAELKWDMNEIGRATGLKSAVLTVNEEGFANSMLGYLKTDEEGTI